MGSDIDDARGFYRGYWQSWRRNLDAGELFEANQALTFADELAQQWVEKGKLEELLEPLLAQGEDPDVRGAAARQLLATQVNEKALSTLRQLRDSDDPRVAKFATRALCATARLHQARDSEHQHDPG